MATQTPNLGLDKPAGNERPLISVLNGNADKIDAAIGDVDVTQDGSLQDQIDSIQESVSCSTDNITPSADWSTGAALRKIGKIVFVSFNTLKTTGNIIDGEQFATIPEGYRPQEDIIIPCHLTTADGSVGYGGVGIHTNGTCTVGIKNGVSALRWVAFSTSYITS